MEIRCERGECRKWYTAPLLPPAEVFSWVDTALLEHMVFGSMCASEYACPCLPTPCVGAKLVETYKGKTVVVEYCIYAGANSSFIAQNVSEQCAGLACSCVTCGALSTLQRCSHQALVERRCPTKFLSICCCAAAAAIHSFVADTHRSPTCPGLLRTFSCASHCPLLLAYHYYLLGSVVVGRQAS